MGAFGEVAEVERADGDADEAEDFDAEGVEHAADVAILAFVEGELEPGVFFTDTEDAGLFTAENLAALRFDTAFEGFD